MGRGPSTPFPKAKHRSMVAFLSHAEAVSNVLKAAVRLIYRLFAVIGDEERARRIPFFPAVPKVNCI